jgi:hypothetical protein
MKIRIYDRQDAMNPLNGIVVYNSADLLEIINSLTTRSPFFCELEGENGYNLLIGIGGLYGCVQYSARDGSTPYLMATAGEAETNNEYVEFLIGNTPTPVARRYCLPFDQVREIAVHFQNTGDRSLAVGWEKI